MNNMVNIEVGKVYKMGNVNVMCIKQKKSGLYKIQTLGMTSGPWPGEGDISSYNKITSFFALTWKGVISKFRLPKLTEKIKACEGKTYKVLTEAALNYSSFMSSFNNAWLGTVYGRNGAWCVSSGGNVYSSNYQNYSCVVAPCFNLDPSKISIDGNEIKRKPKATLKPGEEYKMSGYRVVCIEHEKNGLYKMQTLGMTSGTWPGEGDISDYDDVTKSFTKNWAGITSKFKLPKLTEKIDVHEGKTRKALTEAAKNYSSFGDSSSYAWLGTVGGSYHAWCVCSDGNVVSDNGGQGSSCVVAPGFLLDPSKIILDGDEIKRKNSEVIKTSTEELEKELQRQNSIRYARYAIKEPEEILAARDENNHVEGYIQLHISDVIVRDYEAFLSIISKELVGSDLLMEINYDVVGLSTEPNELILRVSGDASNIVDNE